MASARRWLLAAVLRSGSWWRREIYSWWELNRWCRLGGGIDLFGGPFHKTGHWRGRACRSCFTTLPPVPLQEQYRCGSFVGGAQITRGVGYEGIQWTREFMWFGPPERNTLRPQKNGVVLLCLKARLRSSFVYLCVCVSLASARPFYSPRPGSYSETP
jgi:hypothetical protein